MKQETRIKWNAFKRGLINFGKSLAPLALGAFVGGTIAAAWEGLVISSRNEKEIDKLKDKVDENEEVMYHNARCSKADRNRLNELTRQTNLLMEKAMNVTEGKEEAA